MAYPPVPYPPVPLAQTGQGLPKGALPAREAVPSQESPLISNASEKRAPAPHTPSSPFKRPRPRERLLADSLAAPKACPSPLSSPRRTSSGDKYDTGRGTSPGPLDRGSRLAASPFKAPSRVSPPRSPRQPSPQRYSPVHFDPTSRLFSAPLSPSDSPPPEYASTSTFSASAPSFRPHSALPQTSDLVDSYKRAMHDSGLSPRALLAGDGRIDDEGGAVEEEEHLIAPERAAKRLLQPRAPHRAVNRSGYGWRDGEEDQDKPQASGPSSSSSPISVKKRRLAPRTRSGVGGGIVRLSTPKPRNAEGQATAQDSDDELLEALDALIAEDVRGKARSQAKLAVVLLNAEGDQFNASLVAQGKEGGKAAATELHRLTKEELLGENGGETLIQLVAPSRDGSFVAGDATFDRFLAGFASAPELCQISLPLEDSRGSFGRVLQLLMLNLPLASVSTIFLGSLHTDYLAPYLDGLPPRLRSKICLLKTVTVAPAFRQLVDDGLFRMSDALEGVFGEVGEATYDLAGLAEVEPFKVAQVDEPVPVVLQNNHASFVVDIPRPVTPPHVMPEPSVASRPPSPPQTVSQQTSPSLSHAELPAATPSHPGIYEHPEKRRNKQQRQQSEITPYDLFNPPVKRQTRFPAPPPYPTGAFKFKYFRYPPNERPCNSYWMDPAGCGLGNRCKYVHDCD
ncbi:uncharacterized protein JCM10292_003953 [Rhodotorula paludigena]|uniref:uncharacterized protein n=1 Tax=Rhodotorula paludigena TaxID=86838 RepID=UPI00316F29AD